MLKNSADLPERPGIYIFRSAAGKALYVGKAVNLRRRVAHYFQKKDDPLIRSLLERSATLETIVTEAEADALLLESNLVHSYLPPFNIRLKDDKSFPFIEITLADDFPGIYFSRHISPGSFIVGPLVNAGKARSLIDTVTRLFRLRTCGAALFRKGIPCLYFHIERCSAPCAGRVERSRYCGQVADAVDFLKGRKGKLLARLKGRMRSLARRQDFERAQKAKEDLELMDGFSLRSCISARGRIDSDVIVSCLLGREAFFVHLALSGGRVSKNGFFHLQTLRDSEDEALREFLIDFYRLRPLPGEILVSMLPAQAKELADFFSKRAERRVRMRVPQRGKKKNVLDLAMRNLAFFVQKSDFRVLGEEIQKMLRLRHFPAQIEGFDISHLGEMNRVGAQVVFKNGRPEKRLYRSYIIRAAAPGDTEALKEVLNRRFRREPSPPDLLLIDGGLPQLGVARQVKADLGLSCDLLALAKGEERIFLEDGTSLVPPGGSLLRHLLQNIRDEVHRRAVTHHRRRREMLPS
ncbi:MAG: excinuclease ABC subunit UvrC [Acidobacteriota bacterium]|nr:excinuclease ABC subunit UvrC [Acidobacteriota bacterium]